MEATPVQYLHCKGCRCRRAEGEFEVVKGIRRKTCVKCQENRKNNKCQHQRRRNRCVECGGASICEHQRRRNECVECDGASICSHQLQRHQCKKCSDPVHLTILTMIKASKATDKAKNRYDQTNFVDYCFVSNLIDDSEGKCCYCSQDIQFIHFQDNLATIERLDDSIGHIKGNCAIACRGCNVRHVKHPTTPSPSVVTVKPPIL